LTTYTTYNLFGSAATGFTIGAQAGTGDTIADTNSPPGDVILGTVPSDIFTDLVDLPFIYLGYLQMTVAGTAYTGAVCQYSDGRDFVFFETGTPDPGTATSVIFTATAPSTGGGEYNATVATPEVVCFVAGTMIATPQGERAVETLGAGELVLTAAGCARQIRRAGRSVVSTLFADPVATLPIRIRAGALAENVPVRDLLVSPGHAVLIDDLLVHAGALVNGASITRESGMPPVFAYHHLELDAHDLLVAEGAPAESFLQTTADVRMDNWDERAGTPGEAPSLEMDLPRVKAPRQLPMRVRQKLAARAEALRTDSKALRDAA